MNESAREPQPRARAASILVAGAWDDSAGYTRTAGLLDGLARLGLSVQTAHSRPPSAGVAGGKARLLRTPWNWPRYALGQRRCKRTLQALLERQLEGQTVDAVLVPYPGHLAVHWVREVVGARVPIVLDLFLSAFGTVVEDRALFRAESLAGRWFRRLDRHAVDAADLVLLDTPQHAAYVETITRTSGAIDWVPITDLDAPDALPSTSTRRVSTDALQVLFFGTGVSLHGLPTLCEAVTLCDANVHLTLVGGSERERSHARRLVPGERLTLGDTFEPSARLRRRIAETDLVAGVFGTSRKAQVVVPYKVVHALGAGRPVLTGDTEAIRSFLDTGSDCAVAAVGDVVALADRLAQLAGDRARLEQLGARGRRAFERCFSPSAAAVRLGAVLERVGIRPAPANTGVGERSLEISEVGSG